MTVLVLEASTASAKAMVFDDEKGIVQVVTKQYDAKAGTLAEQDAELVWMAVLEAGRSVAAGRDIKAVSLVCTWHSLLCCDKHMKPLTPSYTWAYTDASPVAAELHAAGDFGMYSETGCMAHAMFPALKIKYLRERGLLPENCLFAGQGSYIFHKLTGEFLESGSVLSGTGLFSLHTDDFSGGMLAWAGVERRQFGRTAGFCDTRPLISGAASLLGLPEGLPVVPAMPDGAMNQLGAGAMKQGIMTVSIGTSGALRLYCDNPVTLGDRSAWCYRGAFGFLTGAAVSGAANCVDWFKRNVTADAYSYEELDGGIRPSPGAPVFLPFIFGERCPGWRDERRGGFEGLSGVHTHSDMYYALLEGVLMNLYQCYNSLAKEFEVKELRVSGGINKSPVWLKMLADLFGRVMTIHDSEQMSLLGGAALALHAAGGLDDISSFSPGEGTLISPDSSKREYYDERYAKYLKYYNNI